MPAKKTGSETGTTKAKKTSTKKTTKKVETPVEVKKKVFTGEWKKMSFSINFKPDGKNLVIVESPAKAKTIQGYLGSDYQVIASMGHVVDLPVKSVGINTKTFEVDYIVTPEKIDQVKKIANLAQQSKKIWLATDEDREGEAISRHLARTLNLDIANTPRIVFHEITKKALEKAVQNPRTIDMNLVDAQQSRRVVDRLVWYGVSPVLWNKIKRWLSAWRVQSVAVKLLVEREKEIRAFIPSEFWKLWADLQTVEVELSRIWKNKVEKIDFDTYSTNLDTLWLSVSAEKKHEKTWNKVQRLSPNKEFELVEIITKPGKKSPSAPFTTSTLQQVGSRLLWRSVKQVMMSAQKLYENWFITYMRTDSVNLSAQAIENCKEYISKRRWEKFSQPREFKTKSKNAQEAHEAIRPTDLSRVEISWLTPQDQKLYNLIWSRTLASQMADAAVENTTYHFQYDENSTWSASGQRIMFQWFLTLYNDSEDDDAKALPIIEKWDKLTSKLITATQDFTKPPARFTEATLVKELESRWIGRPSTYAPTISTIIDRWYVIRDEKKLKPTTIAEQVTDYLDVHFKEMMKYEFTARLEDQLDEISEWKHNWVDVMTEFYASLESQITLAQWSERSTMTVEKPCPKCWGQLVIKHGGSSSFVWCVNYPECTFTEPLAEEQTLLAPFKEKYEWQPCPAWWTLVVKNWRFGPFLVSSDPTIKWLKSISAFELDLKKSEYPDHPCPECKKWTMTLKKSRRWLFFGCSNYPTCKNTENIVVKKEEWEVEESKVVVS